MIDGDVGEWRGRETGEGDGGGVEVGGRGAEGDGVVGVRCIACVWGLDNGEKGKGRQGEKIRGKGEEGRAYS